MVQKYDEAWERVYLEEGAEGLAVVRCGRGSTNRPQEAEEEFMAENQHLRAQVSWQKNLQTLILEDK